MAPPDAHHRVLPAPTATRGAVPSSRATGSDGERPTGFGEPEAAGTLPAAIHVVERAPSGGWAGYRGPVVVLVHGALDRAGSFSRTQRRLPDWGIVAYDRRGYQGSRQAGLAPDVWAHVDDLLSIVAAYHHVSGRVTVVGHSVGGTIALAGAWQAPDLVASVGAYEPSVPWLGFRGALPGERPGWGDPDQEVERFFRRMAGEGAWERLSERGRATRRADGPALVRDLASLRAGAPFDVTALSVPALFAVGGPASAAHHRQSVGWLASHVPGASYATIAEAGHGAHLSHPDHFSGIVRRAVALAGDAAGASAR